MKRFLGFAFAVTLAASPLASARPRHTATAPLAPFTAARVVLDQHTPQPPGAGLCCCRAWTHGWQYSWQASAACTTANGSCVSPDHC